MVKARGTVTIYADGSDFFGWLIQRFSGGHYTHVAFSLGDGTALQCDARFGGACRESDGDTGSETARFAYPGDVEFVIRYLTPQVGKTKYDFCRLLANPFWNVFHAELPMRVGLRNCATFLWEAMHADAHNPTRNALDFKPLSTVTPTDIYRTFDRPVWRLP